MKAIKSILETIALLIGANSSKLYKAVDAGICDFSGQGRDAYGR